jgi:hypothetical protein
MNHFVEFKEGEWYDKLKKEVENIAKFSDTVEKDATTVDDKKMAKMFWSTMTDFDHDKL